MSNQVCNIHALIIRLLDELTVLQRHVVKEYDPTNSREIIKFTKNYLYFILITRNQLVE